MRHPHEIRTSFQYKYFHLIQVNACETNKTSFHKPASTLLRLYKAHPERVKTGEGKLESKHHRVSPEKSFAVQSLNF